MTRNPVRILLWTEEACQAAYLETVLEMEAPGLAKVVRCDDFPLPGQMALGRCDLVLLAVAATTHTGPDAAWDLPLDPAGAPVIVVSPWLPGFAEVHQLMRLGAEDVLGLAELSPRRLVAAIVKAVERRTRRDVPRARLPFAAEAERLAHAPAHTPPSHAPLLPRFGLLAADAEAAPAC